MAMEAFAVDCFDEREIEHSAARPHPERRAAFQAAAAPIRCRIGTSPYSPCLRIEFRFFDQVPDVIFMSGFASRSPAVWFSFETMTRALKRNIARDCSVHRDRF